MSRPRREWFMSENQKKKIQNEAMKDLGLQPLNNTTFEKNKHNDRNGKKHGHQDKKNWNNKRQGHQDKRSFGGDNKKDNKNRREGGENSEVNRGRHQSGRNGKNTKKTKGIQKNSR